MLAACTLGAPAAAGQPADDQYGPGDFEPPVVRGPNGGPGSPGDGPLPFTGLQLGIALFGGFAAVGSGFVLRRWGNKENEVSTGDGAHVEPAAPAAYALPEKTSVGTSTEGNGPAPTSERADLARCPLCGRHFDAKRYQIVVGGQAFDTFDCASRSRDSSAPTAPAYQTIA